MSTIKGLQSTLKKLESLGDTVQKKVNDVVGLNAQDLEAKAKQKAPVDLGKLRQSIKAIQVDKNTWKIYANATGLAPYAAYVEFGTGGLVSVPKELKEMAIRFKGQGIRKIDLRPQPYLYPALVSQRKIFLADLEELLITETKKV